SGVVIEGNLVGTNAAGNVGLNTSFQKARADSDGIVVTDSFNNTVGGTDPQARNVIAGNGASANGVVLAGAGSSGNVIEGNYVGTDITGSFQLLHQMNGVWLHAGAHDNTIGGTAAGARNVIGGASSAGINLSDAATTGNSIQGNYVGIRA